MSATLTAPYKDLGPNGDYPIEANYGIRIYDNKGEIIPGIGETKATLKGGLRTNHIGIVPLLDGNKENIGNAEVIKIIIAKPENMELKDINACGFQSIDEAIAYVSTEHKEEFDRDGVMTVYYFKVIEKNK